MAVNEKPVFAATTTTFGGKIYRPGQEMPVERVPDYARRQALEAGVATDDPKRAAQAKDAERARVQDVADQQRTRSRKREPGE